MQKNVASQKWIVFAFDRTDNTAKTGDAANITANLRIDGGAANAVDDVNPTELEDGFYIFDITQAESNGNYILISPASSTGDIQVIGCPAALYTTPPNFVAMGIESDGDLTKVNSLDGHTVQTGDSYAIVNSGTYGNAKLVRSTTPANTLDISATGEAGLDFDNIKNATGAHTLTNITVPIVTTNTDMVGTDNAALASVCTETRLAELAAANLPTDIANIKTDTGAILTDTNELQGDWANTGRLDTILDELTTQGDTNEGKLDTIDAVVDAVLVDTGTTIPGLIAALNNLAAADVWDLASALTLDFGTLMERMYQGIFNKEIITDANGNVALRDVGDSTDLATWGITDNDTLTVRTIASWA